MRIYDILKKKRDGYELNSEEIDFFIESYTNDVISDYHASAMLMAMFINGMSEKESAFLTKAMLHSGDIVDLSGIEGIKVDKHSTGGVGDTTTLIVGPIVAACGVPVAKMSGRGLGHTGGTLDKLESIPGFKIERTMDEFIKQVNDCGLAVISQTNNIVPADKKLYKLRDVTATVDSIPLIAGSIMSKKLASGSDAILLDVKVGSGAFMKNIEDAKSLAKEMVSIGKIMKKKTVAVITDMNQPLGNAIGNSLEVKEAIEVLKGEGPEDLRTLCIELSARLVTLGNNMSYDEAKELVIRSINDGSALRKFSEFVLSQGGKKEFILDDKLLPEASFRYGINAEKSGYLSELNSEEIGISAMILGAGRENYDSKIDYSAGIVLTKKIGDFVSKGEMIAEFHYNDTQLLENAKQRFTNAYIIKDERPTMNPLIYQIIE